MSDTEIGGAVDPGDGDVVPDPAVDPDPEVATEASEGDDTVTGDDAERLVPTDVDDVDVDVTESEGPVLGAPE